MLMNKKLRLSGTSIGIIVVLIAGFSLIFPEVYKDNEFVKNAWFGNDLITAFLTGPILIVLSLIKNMKEKLQFSLFLGMLWYMFYNYFFYLFGSAFNPLFLIYLLIIILSGKILISSIAHIFIDKSYDSIKILNTFGIKIVGIFLIMFGSLIALMWISLSLFSIIKNIVPPQVEQTGGITAIIFAIDLLFLVPSTLISGTLLLKQKKGGQELSIIVLSKCIPYGGVLLLMHLISLIRGGQGDAFVLLWFILTILSLTSWLYLVKNFNSNTDKN